MEFVHQSKVRDKSSKCSRGTNNIRRIIRDLREMSFDDDPKWDTLTRDDKKGDYIFHL